MIGPARHAQVLARAAARLDRHLPRHTLSGETRTHTAARTVAINRAVGRAAKRRRVPRQVYPRAIEADYGKRLASLVARTREALAPLLAEIPALATAARSERRDGARLDAGSSSRVEKLIEQARAAVERLSDPKDADKVAREFAATTNSYQRVQLGRQTRAALGVDLYSRDARLPSIVDHFAAENVALIKSIPSQLLDQVHQMVTRGVPGAQPVDQLQADIVARFGVAERRARLIARDQIGKLYGQVNAYRQRDLGVTRFTWRTVHDERVRSEHAALDGQTFEYASPPSEGLPGEAIQCRCSADPDFSSIQALAQDPTASVDQPLPEPSPAPARPVTPREATAFLNEVGDRAQTPIEQQAIRDYQGGKYVGIQDYARTSKLYEGSPFENTAEAKATLKALDGAISKGSLPRDTVLYRGVGEGRAGITGALEPGGVIRDRGYASTSIDRATAEEFAKGKPGATLFEIEAPRGTAAAFVPGDGSLQEAELLLGRGTKFHVLSVRDVDGVKVARVTLRADAAAAAATAPAASATEVPIWEKPKNPKRQAAARLAGQASAERTREIYSAVKTNLAPELQVAWDKEGHKFLREESDRIKGVKDRINAASRISEAFAETYGAGEAGAYEGDRFAKRLEIEAAHGEQWADEQTAKYYAQLEREAAEDGTIGADGNPTAARIESESEWLDEAATPGTLDEDPPF